MKRYNEDIKPLGNENIKLLEEYIESKNYAY